MVKILIPLKKDLRYEPGIDYKSQAVFVCPKHTDYSG